jgi:hypothetical protein
MNTKYTIAGIVGGAALLLTGAANAQTLRATNPTCVQPSGATASADCSDAHEGIERDIRTETASREAQYTALNTRLDEMQAELNEVDPEFNPERFAELRTSFEALQTRVAEYGTNLHSLHENGTQNTGHIRGLRRDVNRLDVAFDQFVEGYATRQTFDAGLSLGAAMHGSDAQGALSGYAIFRPNNGVGVGIAGSYFIAGQGSLTAEPAHTSDPVANEVGPGYVETRVVETQTSERTEYDGELRAFVAIPVGDHFEARLNAAALRGQTTTTEDSTTRTELNGQEYEATAEGSPQTEAVYQGALGGGASILIGDPDAPVRMEFSLDDMYNLETGANEFRAGLGARF